MKNTLIPLLCVLFFNCSAQFKNKAWLPENFIQAMSAGDTDAYKNLFPIEGFMYDGGGILLMLGYGAEPSPVSKKNVIVDGKKKYELLHVSWRINMKGLTRSIERFTTITDSIAKKTFYFSMHGDKILLEIIDHGQYQKVLFVDHDGDCKFRDIYDAKSCSAEKHKYHFPRHDD